MPYTPKAWLSLPSTSTPVTGPTLQSLERRAVMSAAGGLDDFGPGATSYNAYRVTVATGMGLDVGAAGGQQAIYIPIGGTTGEERRYEGLPSSPAVTVPASDPTNPRIDAVVAEAPADPDATTPSFRVITGTATGVATLDNRTGAAAIPAAALHLADVLVPAGATSIIAGNVRDRRRQSALTAGSFIVGATLGDVVPLEPVAGLPVASATISPTATDNFQGAVLVRLRRRVTANRLRWRYIQGATPAASNYFVGIADFSGRPIATIAATAFTGAAASLQSRNETITSQTFEPGLYWLMFGIAAMTAASSVTYLGVGASSLVGAPGVGARLTSGGATAPTTILGFSDLYGGALTTLPVPLMSLANA